MPSTVIVGKVYKEFSEFGAIKKIFIEKSGKYSKVYFDSSKTCKEVADAFKVNHLGWIVDFPQTLTDLQNLEQSLRAGVPPSESSVHSSNQGVNRDSMMDFTDEDEGEFTQNTDYCTLHGDPVTVLTDDSGEIYVNYRDVKKAGQISKEFELYLLAEARAYILKKRVKFSEEEILSTIERCREKVLCGQSNAQTATNDRRSVNAAGPSLTVTNGNAPGFAGSREEFKRPRPPHNNFQLNNSVTNERSGWNNQSIGGDRRDSHRSRDSGRGGSNCAKFGGRQNRFIGSSENINDFGNNVPNDNDIARNRSNVQESARSKPSDQDFERNKQAGGASRYG
nr:unnamed protein product [Callosobruchus analis]